MSIVVAKSNISKGSWKEMAWKLQEGSGMTSKNEKVGFAGPRALKKVHKRALFWALKKLLEQMGLLKKVLQCNEKLNSTDIGLYLADCEIFSIGVPLSGGQLWPPHYNWVASSLPRSRGPKISIFYPFLLFSLSSLWSFVEQFQPTAYQYKN